MSYNPDYPTNFGAFNMHTYQDQPVSDMFYYNGQNVMSGFYNNMNQADSRRNINMGPTPGYPTIGYPTQQPQPQQLQPFSTYPSGTPTLNAMVDSRRAQTGAAVNNAYVQNPWGGQPVAPQSTICGPASNPFQPQQPVAQYPTDYLAGYPQQDPMSYWNMGSNSLYGNTLAGFDKKAQCWDNPYTNMRPLTATPDINWNSNNYNAYPTQPQYPNITNYPAVNASWDELAKQNWNI